MLEEVIIRSIDITYLSQNLYNAISRSWSGRDRSATDQIVNVKYFLRRKAARTRARTRRTR